MSEIVTVPVPLGARSYDVRVGDGALEASGERLAALCPRGRALIVADRAAWAHHGARMQAVLAQHKLQLELFEIEGGERAKTWDQLKALVDALLAVRIERKECIIAFGGGTVGDLAGFAAAITLRGVGFVQIPTSLLAQVDSSVGGKTGINTSAGKNLAGAFHQPSLVIADTGLLDTLPARELRAGYAEIVKAGLIADRALFERLETAGAKALSRETLPQAIADAVAFKAQIVAQDEREGGVRALLNLGHTFGHAFEAEAVKGALIHGEAVAAGLTQAYAYSERIGVCPSGTSTRIAEHLRAVGLPAFGRELPGGPYEASALVERMGSDKKNSGGAITLILARGLGEAYIAPNADRADLTQFLEEDLNPT